ncbi:MAG: hypothetical protein A2756_05450 [Candidatus Ryanbacteria bacterium RIFCSPHIGHO2_01_FULL_48_27]|uniref:Nudix hydrolase domain-containing protein n=1 Tax=Candidatus Ryanbacteria bacterium RIFCSPHIGHO2_01_FULL_48_27 TaxID=1802115 RepID=A0A1G2G583_9BACT|nr:MAG: hypothetical protein A2756_05450 [Candidatus Ryanbacteria bacterium RIFCSPHIGHO2_01_FULL_48_27]
MAELRFKDEHSPRQRKVLNALPDTAFEGHQSGALEEYGSGKSTLADRINNSDTSVLERVHLLTDVFEKRKNSILKTIRSVRTKNLASVTIADVRDAMQKYESEIKTMKGARSNLADYFPEDKTEVMLAGGLYHIVQSKEAFFKILADEIHEDLFRQTEFFKNVSGVYASRIDPSEGLEDKERKYQVLIVKNKNGIWQFPGGKAEYVCLNPGTGKSEVVTKQGDVWQFEDGKEAPKDKVVFETPEECLRREISEELRVDVGPASLNSSGFYTIGESRWLIHGFVANNLLEVDREKVNKEEIRGVRWTSDPFNEKEEDGTPIKLTDQAVDVLKNFFQNLKNVRVRF